MNQYTSKEQTNTLLQLGFPKPHIAPPTLEFNEDYDFVPRYTIGELIDMLPKMIDYQELSFYYDNFQEVWIVGYWGINPAKTITSDELIDAICEMIKRLVQEGKLKKRQNDS